MSGQNPTDEELYGKVSADDESKPVVVTFAVSTSNGGKVFRVKAQRYDGTFAAKVGQRLAAFQIGLGGDDDGIRLKEHGLLASLVQFIEESQSKLVLGNGHI